MNNTNDYSVKVYLMDVPGQKDKEVFASTVMTDQNRHLLNYVQNLRVYFDPRRVDELRDGAIELGRSIGEGIFETVQGEICRQARHRTDRGWENANRDENGVYHPNLQNYPYKRANVQFYRGRRPRTGTEMREYFSAENLASLGA